MWPFQNTKWDAELGNDRQLNTQHKSHFVFNPIMNCVISNVSYWIGKPLTLNVYKLISALFDNEIFNASKFSGELLINFRHLGVCFKSKGEYMIKICNFPSLLYLSALFLILICIHLEIDSINNKSRRKCHFVVFIDTILLFSPTKYTFKRAAKIYLYYTIMCNNSISLKLKMHMQIFKINI